MKNSTRCRSIVAPRVTSDGQGVRLLKNIIVDAANSDRRLIRITGEGKSTAIRYLKEQFAGGENLQFLDNEPIVNINKYTLTVYASPAFISKSTTVKLAPWALDDCIEYMLANANEQCKSVINRLQKSDDLWLGSGSPTVIAAALDAMSTDPSLDSFESAIVRHFELFEFRREQHKTKVLNCCLRHLLNDSQVFIELKKFVPDIPRDLLHFLSVQTVRYALVIDKFIAQIGNADIPGCLRQVWTPMLTNMVAERLTERQNERALDELERLANLRNEAASSNAVNILHRYDSDWKPTSHSQLGLQRAQLAGVEWSEFTAERSKIDHADFRAAQLPFSSIRGSVLTGSDFSHANLHGSQLGGIVARDVDFTKASLHHAHCCNADFQNSDLSGADLNFGDFSTANFTGADLTNATLNHAKFLHAIFLHANLTRASFFGSVLNSALLNEVDLRSVELQQVQFQHCSMTAVNLAEKTLRKISFDDSDLRFADWSNAHALECSMRDCKLRNGMMGQVNWLNCDLRGADFTGCQFNYGSTRSGLVDSPYPSHGTRTGFYTDEYEDQYFKSVDEIRKASFRGCDFTEANVFAADFYLVDLREAKFAVQQENHFRRCGAILR